MYLKKKSKKTDHSHSDSPKIATAAKVNSRICRIFIASL
jgi:hypothetical protein